MEKDSGFKPKPLALTYEEFQDRGATIQNMMIDKYVVYDLIGMGSYGSVYRGMDDETKKEVAIKLINMRLVKTDKNQTVKQIKLRLSESQPRLMYMCDSPFLLKCYDVYENSDLKVLIIEFCNGKTLQDEIDEKKRIPEKQAWIILKHIINGLVVLHSHKIVHRDLKAQNIMSHNGTYKIIDFGFSKKLQIAQQNAECRNTSLGTITTMAPEVMGRKPYGLKADIWSIGIIFFQMIYGQYPYDSSTAAQMYRQIQVKKLFNKQKPFTFNGYTPTQDAFNFLRQTVVVETDRRADWRAVSEYPNIKNSDDLSQRFIKQCDIKLDSQQLDYNEVMETDRSMYALQFKKEGEPSPKKESVPQGNEQKKNQQKENKQEEQPVRKLSDQHQSLEKSPNIQTQASKQVPKKQEEPVVEEKKKKGRFNLQQTIKKEKIQEQARNKRIKQQEEEQERARKKRALARTPNIRKVGATEIKEKYNQVNREEQMQYEWTKIAHLQCLKTQFVFRQIVYPLEVQVLNSEDRSTIQFYYLLSARCFNNMSPIKEQLEERQRKNQNRELINNLNDQIQKLYTQVHKKFLSFSKSLTEKENKTTSIVKDWFSKKIYTEDFKQKDRFLTGIEKIQYSKQQQIKFTFTYYYQNLRSVIAKSKNSLPVQRRLNHYTQIMLVTLEDLKQKGLDFETYVQQITKKQ